MSNIIKLDVNEIMDTITMYIIGKEKNPKINKNSFMLIGPPGLGKSESIRQIGIKVKKELNKQVNITDVRLLLFNPVDLRGIPIPDVNKEFAKWLKPEIFKMDESDETINILFLDEITGAPPSVQAAAYQMVLDYKIGEHELPANCYVICAGNRVEDKSVAYKMPKALSNRLIHFEIINNVDNWISWAIKNKFDKRIIAYISARQDALYKFDPSSDDNAFATPRTWSFVNNFLQIIPDIDKCFNLICGAIGLSIATEFKTYIKIFDKLPNTNDILQGKKVNISNEPDVLYAILASIITAIQNSLDNENQEIAVFKLKNVISFSIQIQTEYSVFLMSKLMSIENVTNLIYNLPEYDNWLEKNGSLIL